jgi:hypothetical protein
MACMPDESLPLTDLKELGREVLADGPTSALPCNLPDHWLRRIARDLDACWPDSEPVEEHSLYMSGPLALVLHLLLGKTGQSTAAVSFEQLERYFKEYRQEVNFELISRVTNVSVEPATLASIFEGRTVTVKLDQDWEPEEN